MDKPSLYELLQTKRPLLMGVLNITPDSIHDGGCYFSEQAAIAQLDALIAQGADIVDIGGASSRPGHNPVCPEEEWRRLSLVIDFCQQRPVLFSVDTDQLSVAEKALAHGADILNYSGGKLDEEFFQLVAQYGVPMILMHRQGKEGCHENVVEEILTFFQQGIAMGLSLGMKKEQFVLDPGPGFNKDVQENIALMAAIPQFLALGYPLLMAFSHKRFIAALSGEKPGSAPLGNLAAAAFCVDRGAHILRMHDITPLKRILDRQEM